MSTNRNFYKKAQREQNRENRKADAAKKVTHKYDGDKTGKDNYKADYVAGQVKNLTDEDMRRHGLDLEGA